jgi:hypothetical protein
MLAASWQSAGSCWWLCACEAFKRSFHRLLLDLSGFQLLMIWIQKNASAFTKRHVLTTPSAHHGIVHNDAVHAYQVLRPRFAPWITAPWPTHARAPLPSLQCNVYLGTYARYNFPAAHINNSSSKMISPRHVYHSAKTTITILPQSYVADHTVTREYQTSSWWMTGICPLKVDHEFWDESREPWAPEPWADNI